MFSEIQLDCLPQLSLRGQVMFGYLLVYQNKEREFSLPRDSFYAQLRLFPHDMSADEIEKILADLMTEIRKMFFPKFNLRFGDNDLAEFETIVTVTY